MSAPFRRVFFHRRVGIIGKEMNQPGRRRSWIRRRLRITKHKQAPATVRFHQMPQMLASAIRHACCFGRVKPLTNFKASGQLLIFLTGANVGGVILDRRPRHETALPLHESFNLGGVNLGLLGCITGHRTSGNQFRQLAIGVNQLLSNLAAFGCICAQKFGIAAPLQDSGQFPSKI